MEDIGSVLTSAPGQNIWQSGRVFYASGTPEQEYQFYGNYLASNGWTVNPNVANLAPGFYMASAAQGSSTVLIQIPKQQVNGKTEVSIMFSGSE